jgi:hypothetical protein
LAKLLDERIFLLNDILRGRELSSNKEGAGRGHWANPGMMCWVNKDHLAIAVADVKSVLSEISKIK